MKRNTSDDRDLTNEWIPIAEAAGMIGGTVEDVRRLVRMRRMQWRGAEDTVCLDDVVTVLELREFDAVMDGGGGEREARKRAEAVRAKWESKQEPHVDKQPAAPHTTHLSLLTTHQLENCKLIDGHEVVSVRDAAAILGVIKRQIYTLLQNGRISWSEKVGRTRYVLLCEVNDYKRLQGIWETKGGKWTAYGKRERQDGRASARSPVADGRRTQKREIQPITDAKTNSTGESAADDCWIRAEEAWTLLGLKKSRLYGLAAQGKLGRQRELRRVPTCGGGTVKTSVWVYSLRDVLALAMERDASRPCISPSEWNRNLLHPVIRTKIEAPPGDRLISRAEAAEWLGVGTNKISNLVIEGRLFGWQTDPGKSGVRLWLSARQVFRYANDPVRLRRRQAALLGRRRAAANEAGEVADIYDEWPPLYPRTESEARMMDWGLEPKPWTAPSTFTTRDYGEFFTLRQTAMTMGVTPSAVKRLRRRGRLRGYQRPREKRSGGGNKWWFFRKDDVYDLLADGTYLRNRDRGKRVWLKTIKD
jgi:hypothetical protein